MLVTICQIAFFRSGLAYAASVRTQVDPVVSCASPAVIVPVCGLLLDPTRRVNQPLQARVKLLLQPASKSSSVALGPKMTPRATVAGP